MLAWLFSVTLEYLNNDRRKIKNNYVFSTIIITTNVYNYSFEAVS